MSKSDSLEATISNLITERSDALYELYVLRTKSKQMLNLVSKIIDAIDENDYMEIDRLKLLIKILWNLFKCIRYIAINILFIHQNNY